MSADRGETVFLARALTNILLATLLLGIPFASAASARQTVVLNAAAQRVAGEAFEDAGVVWAEPVPLTRALGIELAVGDSSFKVKHSGAIVGRRVDGSREYVSVTELAEELNASLQRTGARVDLLSRITDVRFSQGRVHVTCSLPVTCKVSRLTSPERVYVDISGAKLESAASEAKSEKALVRSLRLAQYSPTTVRVVAETAQRVDFRLESAGRDGKVSLALGETAAASAGAETPLEGSILNITGLRLEEEEASARLVVTTDGTPAPMEGLDLGAGKLWLDFEPAQIAGAPPTIRPQGRLVRQVRVEQSPAGSPKVRLVVQTARVVASRLRSGAGPNEIVWELSVPEGALGDWHRKVVIIDAGHGGRDTGARANGVVEKDVNLAVARLASEDARRRGLDVVMTREKDEQLTLAYRTDQIGKYDTTLFVSIHHNAIKSASVSGAEVYYHKQDADSRALAEIVHSKLVSSTTMPGRGARSDSKLYQTGLFVLRNSPVPAILVEVGYLTNAKDAARVKDAAFQKKAATAIVDGIVSYLGGIPTPSAPASEPDAPKDSPAEKQ